MAIRELIEAYLEDVVLANMEIVPYDDRAAAWHAEQRTKLAAKGKMPSFVDSQIAAIACVHELTLVTRNLRDFEDFDGLTVANWHRTR